MDNYIIKNKSVKKSDLISKKSFSAFSFRKVFCSNKNVFILDNYIESNLKGYEPGSDAYIKFTNNYFVRIGDLNDNEFTFNIKDTTLKIIPPEKIQNVIRNNDICYQTASNVGNVCIFRGEKAYYNSHIRKLEFKEKREYIFSILKSNFGKNQVEVGGSIKGVDNFNVDLLKNTIIPFPTIKNHKNPELVEEYVSLITKNIIDKEEQIEKKMNEINSSIENELKPSLQNFNFYHPKKSELLKKDFRLDTGLYISDYKSIVEGIKNYKNGFYKLGDSKKIKWVSGSTPSALIETNKKTDKLWIAVADINYGLTYKRLKSFKLLDKINTVENGDILITRKGATVGKMIIYFDSGYSEAFVNEDIKVLRLNKPLNEKVFIGLFLNSKFGQVQMLSNGSKGTKQGLTNPNILNVVIPDFLENFKLNLSKLYYNEVEKNNTFDLEKYLAAEKTRNEKLGITNLNLECFELVEKLNEIINKIINEEPIIF